MRVLISLDCQLLVLSFEKCQKCIYIFSELNSTCKGCPMKFLDPQFPATNNSMGGGGGDCYIYKRQLFNTSLTHEWNFSHEVSPPSVSLTCKKGNNHSEILWSWHLKGYVFDGCISYMAYTLWTDYVHAPQIWILYHLESDRQLSFCQFSLQQPLPL